MTMTRQHFQFIADVIREKFNDPGHRTMVAMAFADRLGDTNPRFNRLKFIAACSYKASDGQKAVEKAVIESGCR